VWVNELRVSGYDEQNGWSALANASIQLADLGRIKGNWQTQTDGFGSLSSTLGDREQRALDNWSFTTELNLDKPIPERFGWSIPVSFQMQSSTSTPRFAPSRGDIRLEEILGQIDQRVEDGELTPEEGEQAKQEAVLSAETHSETRSFTARISKSGSDNVIVRNTLDALSASYSFSETEARNPSQVFNDSWRWSSTLNYRLNIRKARTVRPFWFLDSIPLLSKLGELHFNYLPQSFSATGSAARSFSESKERPRSLIDTLTVTQDLVRNPLRDKHTFTHNRNFGVQYNPFAFLNLSLDTNTGQSLNAIGVDTLSFVVDTSADSIFTDPSGKFTLDDWLNTVPGADPDEIGVSVFQLDELEVLSVKDVLPRMFNQAPGQPALRTDRHDQRFSGTIRIRFTKSKFLDWLNIQDIVYGAQYSWQNGSVSRNNGASVSNQVDLRTGLSVRLQDLFRKFGFYRGLETPKTKSGKGIAAVSRSKKQGDARKSRGGARRKLVVSVVKRAPNPRSKPTRLNRSPSRKKRPMRRTQGASSGSRSRTPFRLPESWFSPSPASAISR
jgi:cell surface protein SprA